MICVGIDWSDKSHSLCILDDAGAKLDAFEIPHVSPAGLYCTSGGRTVCTTQGRAVCTTCGRTMCTTHGRIDCTTFLT